jgi:ribosomal protein S18 acetylase RimI-like enzyme
VSAFDESDLYPFCHVPHARLSAHMAHVGGLLGARGYSRGDGELVLEWRDFTMDEPPRLALDVDVRLQWRQRRGERPGLLVHAYDQGDNRATKVGFVVSQPLGDTIPTPAAQDWAYIRWIVVHEAWRGRGLGRYLLTRALAALQGAGYRHTALTTHDDNYPALLFYTNLGYRVVDWTHTWRRAL